MQGYCIFAHSIKMAAKFFLPILLLLIFNSCGNKPVVSNQKVKEDVIAKPAAKPEQKQGLIYPYELKKSSKSAYDDARVRIGDSTILCSKRGKIELADSMGNSRVRIADLHCEYLVDKVYVLPRENDQWFIIWQETYQQGQKTNLAVYKKGATVPVWKTSFPYTNAGPVVLDGEMCYFTTMGMVGKINVDKGEIQWKLNSLYNPFKWMFKRFEVPRIYSDKVVFIDLPEPRREKRDTLILDPASGKRIK